MASILAWLDSSEAERRKAMDIVALFRQQNTVDELGIGAIRDAIADELFPGTSTIQTRARYFLFVPWICRELERRRVASAEVAKRARRAELDLSAVLAAADDNDGAIGSEAGEKLQRLPSSVYWAGLGTWGIRLFPGSQAAYYRSFDAHHRRTDDSKKTSEDQELETPQALRWHPHLPPAPAGFPTGAVFALSAEESDYLRERVRMSRRDSFLARLVQTESPWAAVGAPWEHPLAEAAPQPIRRVLVHAGLLSRVHHGASLLYNLLLAEKRRDDALRDEYREDLTAWRSRLAPALSAVGSWETRDLWALLAERAGLVARPAARFIDAWRDVVVRSDADVAKDAPARALVAAREFEVKRRRARLANPEYLALWNGASGTRALDFRWGQAQRIVLDILEAQKVIAADARAH